MVERLICSDINTDGFIGLLMVGMVQEKVPKLEPIRIPMNQEKAPEEGNFDQIGKLTEY
jgi:hypothetical protein